MRGWNEYRQKAVEKVYAGPPKTCGWSASHLAKELGLTSVKLTETKARQVIKAWATGGAMFEQKEKTPTSFYGRQDWRELRYQALKKYGGRCQCCGAGPMNGKVLHVDHIKPKSLFPELALSLDNLQVLCEDCNVGKSNKDDTDWRATGSPKLRVVK